MKEAFGGVFLMRLLLVFIFIYLVFAAISYNYAQAFRLKNELITYIEEQDISDFNDVLNSGDGKVLQGIDDILNLSTYRVSCGNVEGLLPTDDPLSPQKYCYHGIVITTEEVGHHIHHKVSTFVYWNLPVINTFLLHAANSENTNVVKDAAWEIIGDAVVVKRTDVPEEDNKNQEIIADLQQSYSNVSGNISSGMGNNAGDNVSSGMSNNTEGNTSSGMSNNAEGNTSSGMSNNATNNETDDDNNNSEGNNNNNKTFTIDRMWLRPRFGNAQPPTISNTDREILDNHCKNWGARYEDAFYYPFSETEWMLQLVCAYGKGD